MILFIKILAALLFAHAITDWAIKSDTMGVLKVPKNQEWYWLTAHSMVQGAGVAIVTQNIWLGMAETIVHWFIDFGKCEDAYGIHIDQSLHLFSKILWAVIYISIM